MLKCYTHLKRVFPVMCFHGRNLKLKVIQMSNVCSKLATDGFQYWHWDHRHVTLKPLKNLDTKRCRAVRKKDTSFKNTLPSLKCNSSKYHNKVIEDVVVFPSYFQRIFFSFCYFLGFSINGSHFFPPKIRPSRI